MFFHSAVWAGPIEDFRYAAGLFNRGIYADAASALASFIKDYPDHELSGDARFWIAEALRQSGKPGPARDAYTAILPGAAGSRRAEILLGRAETLRAMREPAAAATDFRAAAELLSDTQRERALTEAALSFLQAGDTPSAAPLLVNLLGSHAETTVEWAGAALGAALVGKDNAGAADAYRQSAKAATSYAWSLQAHLLASTLYELAGDPDHAEKERGEAVAVIAGRPGSDRPVARSEPASRTEAARLFRGEASRLPREGSVDVISAYLPEIAARWADRGETAAALILIEGLDATDTLPLAVRLHQAEARRAPDAAVAHWEAVADAARSYADQLPEGFDRAGARATMADALLELGRRSEAAAAYIAVAEEARAPLAREALRNALLLLEDDRDTRLRKLFTNRTELMESDELLELRAAYALRRGDTDVSLAHLQRMSQTPSVKEQRAMLLLNRGRAGEALLLHEELARSSPDEPAALMGLGRAALSAGEPARAAEVYEQFTKKFPNSDQRAVAYYGLGLALNRVGQSATARAALERALEDGSLDLPLRRSALRLLAALTFNAQEARDAARLYDQLIAEGVDDDDAYFRAGLSHLASDNPARAAEHLAALLARWPASSLRSRAIVALAEASILSDRAAQSGEILAEAARNPDARPRLLDLADARLSANDARSAEEIASRVIDAMDVLDAAGSAAETVTAARAYTMRGWARLDRERDVEAARDFSAAAEWFGASDTAHPQGLSEGLITAAERLMANDPLHALRLLNLVPAGRRLARHAALRRGEALELLHRDTEAVAAYQAAVAVSSANTEDSLIVRVAAVRIGDIRMKTRNWNEAVSAYRIALAMKSSWTGSSDGFDAVELALGAALRQAGRETDAVTVLAPLVERIGDASSVLGGPARLELAFSLLTLGRPAEADSLLQSLDGSTMVEPDRIAYGRGLAARAVGDSFAARRHLLRVVLSYPGSPIADESLFLVGQLERELGRLREAEDSFAALLANYPRSPRVEAARRILGELK